MLQPLYLDSSQAWRVQMDDGVALRITAPGHSVRRVPLRRVGRIVANRQTLWDSAAILGCLQAGIPIVFHDGHETVGWCFGTRRRETTLTQLLREGIGHADWDLFFRNWFDAQQRAGVLAVLRALDLRTDKLDPAHARALLCNAHRTRIGRPCGPWLRALEQAIAGVVAEHMQSAVVDPALLCFPRPGLNLASRLCELLEWQAHRVLARAPAQVLEGTTPLRYAAAAMERHAAPLEQAVGVLFGSLEHELRGWLL